MVVDMIPFVDFKYKPNVIPMSFEQAKLIIDSACLASKEDGYSKYWSRMPEAARRRCQQVIFEHILDVAAEMKFKYISLANNSKSSFSSSEIMGDGSRLDGWPKVWTLAKVTGIGAGCGNSNQYQIHSVYFGPEHEGKWDIKTRTRIDEPDRTITATEPRKNDNG